MTQLPDHTVKMHELPDEYLADVLPIAKKIALAQGLENYNILQVYPPFLFYMSITLPLTRYTRCRTTGA